MACLIDSVVNTEEFKRLETLYPEYDRVYLKDALSLWRETYKYDSDTFPLEGGKKGSFTRFLHTRANKIYQRENTSNVELDDLVSRYTELDSLYDPVTLKSRVDDICSIFIGKVNDYQRKPENVNKKRRTCIAEMGGFRGIMKSILQDLKTRRGSADYWYNGFKRSTSAEFSGMSDQELMDIAQHLADESQIMAAHFDALSHLVARQVSAREHITIMFDQTSKPIDSEEEKLDDDKPQNNSEDGEGAKGDRFTDFRTLNLSETLSEKTKTFLSSIEMRNSRLEVEVSEMRRARMMDDKLISYKLLEIFAGLDDSRDFVDQLEEYCELYPWMYGIVLRLRKDPDARTTLYCDFKRSVYLYSHLRPDEYGTKYEYHYENTSNLQNALMRKAGNTMRSGIPLDERFSLYKEGGLRTKEDREKAGYSEYAPEKVASRLKELFDVCVKLYMRKGIVNPVKTGNEYVTWGNEGSKYETAVEAMTALLDDWEKDGSLDYIIGAFRGAGMDVTKKQLRAAAFNDVSFFTAMIIDKTCGPGGMVTFGSQPLGGNRLGIALYGLRELYSQAHKKVDTYGNTDIDSFYAGVTSQFMKINSAIAPSLEGNVEPSTLVGDKRMQTYNKPNLLHDVFDILGDHSPLSDEQKAEYIKREYEDCEGYTANGKLVGWLGEESLPPFTIDEATLFNGVEYADMSPAQKVISALVRYRATEQVEVSIMADYSSAYNFIKGKSYGVGETQAEHTKENEKIRVADCKVSIDPNCKLVEKVIDEVLSEIELMTAARKRLAAAKEGKWNRIGKEDTGYDARASRFNLFKEFNDDGTYEQYMAANPEARPAEARDIIREKVVSSLEKLVTEDLKYLDELGVFGNKMFRDTLNIGTTEDKEQGMLVDQAALTRIVGDLLNILYGREQVTKILNGGMSQFEGIIDFEKRSMMNHAPRSAFYKDASWKSGGKPVGTGTQKVVYAKDISVPSAYTEQEKKCLQNLVGKSGEKGRITQDQCNYFLSAHEHVKETDGQGFRTFESWRRIMISTNHWSDDLENAYQAIESGNWDSSHIQALINAMEYVKNFKPVYTGYEFIDGYDGGKKIKLSVNHKYAETVLLPVSLLDSTIKGASTPVRGMSKAAEELGVDMFLFTSGVKVNAHSEIDVFGSKDGKMINPTSDDIANAIVKQVSANPHSVHNLDLKYYGESASTPVHVLDTKIAWAAQAETMAFCDIEPDDEVIVGGVQRKATWAKNMYQRIKFSETLAAWRSLQKQLSDPNELEKMLQEELASKTYNSSELEFALRQIKNGSFSIPLFSPAIEHEVTELLTSCIRKRLLSHKTKGTNIFQTTSFGLDVNKVEFQDEGVGESARLKIEWEDKGVPGKERIKYIECYLPITDSWLYRFADDKGMISPERLQLLVDNKIIPESVLYAVGYRTPSDGMHSLFPLKIKGFTSNVEGANIVLPKEAMTMAGLDFDGDKLRVHLKSFNLNWDEEGIKRAYDSFRARFEEGRSTREDKMIMRLGRMSGDVVADDAEIMRVIMGQLDDENLDDVTFEAFERGIKHKKMKGYRFLTLSEDAYDWNAEPENQSSAARDNARIDLIFAHLTSPMGTAKMLIPGGAEETVEMAKRIYIVRCSSDPKIKQILRDAGILEDKDDSSSLYRKLKKMKADALGDIINKIEGYTVPFTLKHSAEAHERIVGGKQLVSVFAKENAVTQILQGLGLRYIPYVYKGGKNKGEKMEMSLFGCPIDELYKTRNHSGTLLSRALSRLLNAAVDNAKEPVLGLVNQCKELSSLTNFLLAAGVDEEKLHVLLSQPVFIEVARRLKAGTYAGLREAISDIIVELTGKEEAVDEINIIINANAMKRVSLEKAIESLPFKYKDLMTTTRDTNVLKTQLSLLYGILHLCPAISELQDISGLIRPDSKSGTINSSLSENTAMADKFRDYVERDVHHIGGAAGRLALRDVDPSQKDSVLFEQMSWLPNISLLNSLFYRNATEFFSPYFPYATESWQKAALKVAEKFSYKKKYGSTMDKVFKDMVLWKLLSTPAFSGGTAESIEQARKYYVIEFPDKLAKKIAEIKKSTEDNPDLYKLKDNIFLNKLSIDRPKWKNGRPRVQFRSGGPSLQGFADSVRHAWAELLHNNDPEIRKLAVDLYVYNMMTNGFGFGMYSFSHLAPFSVIAAADNYLDSLNAMLDPEAGAFPDTESEEFQLFLDQFYLNHWDDARLVPHLSASQIPEAYRGKLGLPSTGKKSKTVDPNVFLGYPYFVLVTKVPSSNGFRTVKTLYKIERSGSDVEFYTAPMFDEKVKQYNPYIEDPLDMEPISVGEDSVYGVADESGRLRSASYRKRKASIIKQAEQGQLVARGVPAMKMTEVRDNVQHNDEILEESGTGESKVKTFSGNWTREQVEKDKDVLYIFTDNTDRNSGSNPIPDDSWYSQRYGKGHHFPRVTAAVIRGLDNARPVSTQRWYHDGAKRETGRWQNSDFEEFKRVIDAEFADIIDAWNTGKYTSIVFPGGDGLFNGSISAITQDRVPDLYNYLQLKFKQLVDYVDGTSSSTVTEDAVVPEDLTPAQPGSDATERPVPSWVSTNVDPSLVMGFLGKKPGKMFHIARRETDASGNVVTVTRSYPVTPSSIKEARRQKAYLELYDRLKEILREKGIAVGVLDSIDERMGLQGVADFDTMKVTAEGLIEMIRIAEGVGGLEALPEEFAHLALEMLGHEHPLVKRLLETLSDNDSALREAFGDTYDIYLEKYGSEMEDSEEGRRALHDKMVLEGAGKLVAKQLLYHQEVESRPIKRLIERIIEAIKSLFRKFSRQRIQDAVFESEEISSALARGILGGRLLDQLDRENISSSGKYLQVMKDLSDKTDIMNRLLQNAVKRVSVFERRLRYDKSSAVDAINSATSKEIEKLEHSIENYTIQQGVYQHLSDSMEYLRQIEETYNAAVLGSYNVGVVSRYLRVYRDAIDSVAKSIDYVKAAIRDGEIESTNEMNSILEKLSGLISAHDTKYQTQAMTLFEELLTNIYGVHGKMQTIGKDKGKVTSIHDMARRAGHDVSVMSRLFHSLADQKDLVLKAFDDATRTAKKNARHKTLEARAKVEEAFLRLVREEGSRDQSFMFKYNTVNGKRVRTGEYITEEESRHLSAAKKHFYDVVMQVKHEIDQYLPESEVGPLKIVMISKTHIERAMQSPDVKSGALALWEGVRNSILDTSDEIDYENKEEYIDFADHRIDMLPIHYVRKNPKLTFDDMTEDVASSILAYAGMGYEYNELSGIIDWLEVSRDMASRRSIEQYSGDRRIIETVSDDGSGYTYSKPYSTVQMHSNMQKALDDFFYMHLYGALQRDEGTIGNTKITKRKAANMLNHFASLSQMAVNLQQRISNVSTGLSMIVVESFGKGTFHAGDVLWAAKQYMKYTPDRIFGFGSPNSDNKLSLWIDYHDVTNDNGRQDKDRRYGKSWAKRKINENLLYLGMYAGEDYLASVTSLALARNFKVKNIKTGKVETLWDAYEVAYLDPTHKTGAHLRLKDGYTKLDGTAITAEDERRFSKRVSGVNFELQGIYNLDDKSSIQQYALGSLVIMYRKWIAPALKRRYGGVDYSILKEQDVEGYYRTFGRYLVDAFQSIKKEGEGLFHSISTNWSRMTDYERGNCRKAITELLIVIGCVVSIAALNKWEPDDDDEDKSKFVTWLDHQFLYQLMRLRNEVGSQAPTPLLVGEAAKILKSPAAAIRPLAAGLDAFQLLLPHNYVTEVRSGRYKGHTKAYKYFFDLPVISMTRNLTNFEDPSSLIKFYNTKSF